MKVRILSDDMASRIAAGEVIERPASVVKELIENSLDAGATEISVSIEASGAALIRVVDDGEGMAPEDVELAVERHATSKIRGQADLDRIGTLGFRGEALPSIASVSRMEIISRTAESESGWQLRVDGGRKASPHAAARARGTTVEVRDLFFNTPARKKFLKSPATELSHIGDVVNRMALAYPEVHFRLFHAGVALADYVAVRELRDRVRQVFGDSVGGRLASFRAENGARTVHGLLSTAPVSFPNSRYLITFVNRRYVRDKVLTHAVLHGYRTLLMKGQYPAAVLFLDLPFEEVDVNVHPAKFEVRFRHQGAIHASVSTAIEAALRRESTRPAPGAAPGWPAGAAEGVSEAALPYDGTGDALRNAEARPEILRRQSPPAPEPRRGGRFGSLSVLGQILGCYIVCASPRGLALIDQHAAHERVVFEKLRAQWRAGRVATQHLLIPQRMELSVAEGLLVEQRSAELERFGFGIEPFGPGSYALTAVPALLREGDALLLVRRVVAELGEVGQSGELRGYFEDRLATMACHSVIRANRQLDLAEIRALLEDLDTIDFATQCPHGRPVLIEIDRTELERLFKRKV